jgi:hypothetical protein
MTSFVDVLKGNVLSWEGQLPVFQEMMIKVDFNLLDLWVEFHQILYEDSMEPWG